MRLGFVVLLLSGVLAGCAPTARVILPAEAPIAKTKQAPLVVGDLDEEPPEDPFAADAMRPCTDEKEINAARTALDAMSDKISRVASEATPASFEPVINELKTLLTTRCFELAAADLQTELTFDTGAALREWWWNGGGDRQLMSYLYPPVTQVTIASKPRPTLMLEGHETHPLAPLLCSATKAGDCGRETAGWQRRAETDFEKTSKANRQSDECTEQLRNTNATEQWSTFLSCKTSAEPQRAAFPIGQFRAMTDGFLAIQVNDGGRCGAMRIYDLATGTAIRGNTCRDPSLSPIDIGRVSVAEIREAAWMLALEDVIVDDHRPQFELMIPSNIAVGRPRDSESGIGLGMIGTSSSWSQTWTWYRPNKNGKLVGAMTGVLTLRGRAATDHAQALLQLAERGFEKGCAPSFSNATFAKIDWKVQGPSVGEHETPQPFDTVESEPIRTALVKAKPPTRCMNSM
jgi:hypothetical protein